jgi:hypothetical protein
MNINDLTRPFDIEPEYLEQVLFNNLGNTSNTDSSRDLSIVKNIYLKYNSSNYHDLIINPNKSILLAFELDLLSLLSEFKFEDLYEFLEAGEEVADTARLNATIRKQFQVEGSSWLGKDASLKEIDVFVNVCHAKRKIWNEMFMIFNHLQIASFPTLFKNVLSTCCVTNNVDDIESNINFIGDVLELNDQRINECVKTSCIILQLYRQLVVKDIHVISDIEKILNITVALFGKEETGEVWYLNDLFKLLMQHDFYLSPEAKKTIIKSIALISKSSCLNTIHMIMDTNLIFTLAWTELIWERDYLDHFLTIVQSNFLYLMENEVNCFLKAEEATRVLTRLVLTKIEKEEIDDDLDKIMRLLISIHHFYKDLEMDLKFKEIIFN